MYFRYKHNFDSEANYFWLSKKGYLSQSDFYYFLHESIYIHLSKISQSVLKNYYHSRSEKEDLIPELCTISLEHIQKLCLRQEYIQYSIGSLIYKYLDRSIKKYLFHPSIIHLHIGFEQSTEEVALKNLELEYIHNSIDKLPCIEKDILFSVYFENKKLTQKAKEINRSISYVCKKKQKAIKLLRSELCTLISFKK